MVKKYYSRLRNFCVEGVSFTTLGAPEIGSCLVTSSREVQEKLEGSALFRRVFKCVPLYNAEETKIMEKEAEENSGRPTFMTDKLQEARDIIMKLRAERGMAYKTFPNTKSVLNAADELGVEFPNLKK